jgi:UDP-N-acetylmuramoyl-L-alanyl-D-glutamate--2,6-diaminopimelate ligase
MIQAAPTGKRLSDLLAGISSIDRKHDPAVRGLTIDSRKVTAGDLFLACAGSRVHGSRFINEALSHGAVAVIVDGDQDAVTDAVPRQNIYPVSDLSDYLGTIAARFYDYPSEKLLITGITGTNGKTSCSQYITQAISDDDNAGYIGTLGYGLGDELEAGLNTTPDAVTLQKLLADMVQKHVRHVVIEVSSHGLAQGRVNAVQFDIAVFTNLSHDHLDYHDSMEAYAHAKRQLFEMPGLRYAVINIDDSYGRELAATLPDSVELISYGTATDAQLHATDISLTVDGLHMRVITPWGSGIVANDLLGRFNVYNLLAVLAVLILSGMEFSDALQSLSRVHTAPGRMQRFGGGAQPLVVVDYAHTPDALQAVLHALREHCDGELWCVFGCGGDRDTSKRAPMGDLAERLADHVIVTDDNPRHEDGSDIIQDILAGISDMDHVQVERDRATAIRRACNTARTGDVVLVAGKGHEDYQQIGDERLPFSDRQQVQQWLSEAG